MAIAASYCGKNAISLTRRKESIASGGLSRRAMARRTIAGTGNKFGRGRVAPLEPGAADSRTRTGRAGMFPLKSRRHDLAGHDLAGHASASNINRRAFAMLGRLSCLSVFLVGMFIGFGVSAVKATPVDKVCIELSRASDKKRVSGCYQYECIHHCKLSSGPLLCTQRICIKQRRVL